MASARGSVSLLNFGLATIAMIGLGTSCSGSGAVTPPDGGGQSGNDGSRNTGGSAMSGAGGEGGTNAGGQSGLPGSDGTGGSAGALGQGSAGRGGATGPDGTATGGQPAAGGISGSGGLAAGGGSGLGGREASHGSGGGPPGGGISGQGGFDASGGAAGLGGTPGVGGMGDATAGSGGTIDQGSGGSGSGGSGVTCTPSAEGWQHILSCDIVAPIGSFHACVDFFATAESAPAVLEREAAACTDEGGTPSADKVCSDVTSLGSCINAVDTDAASADAEYDRPFQYPATDLTAEIVAAGCVEDGQPYVPVGSEVNAGAPTLMICQ